MQNALGRDALFSIPPEAFLIEMYRKIWKGMQKLESEVRVYDSFELSRCANEGENVTETSKRLVEEIEAFTGSRAPVRLANKVRDLWKRRLIKAAAVRLGQDAEDGLLTMEEVEGRLSEVPKCLKGCERVEAQKRSDVVLIDSVQAGAFRQRGQAEKLCYFGIPSLDNALQCHAGNVVVLAGRPGAGKSAFALQARNTTALKGGMAAFISLELSLEELEARSAAWWTQIGSSADFLNGRYDAKRALEVLEECRPAMEKTRQYYHSNGLSIQMLTMLMDQAVDEGVKLVIVDYFQYIGVTRFKGDTSASAFAANSMKIKQYAQDKKVCVLLLSQLHRETSGNSRPGMADLKETGQLEQDAQAIPMLYRDKDGGLKLTMPKNRDGEGIIERSLGVNWQHMRFWEIERSTSEEQSGIKFPKGVKVSSNYKPYLF